MALPRRFPKPYSIMYRAVSCAFLCFLSHVGVVAAAETSWVEPLWVEHIEALEQKGVDVGSYREKTQRLHIMLEPNDREALVKLMLHHAQWKSKLAALLAHHILALDEQNLDPKAWEVARVEKAKWDEAKRRGNDKVSSYAEFTWPKIELVLKQGKYDQAEELLLDMLWDYPGDEKALRFLAQLYLFKHEWRLADVVYEVLQAQGLEDVEILNNRTLLQVQMEGVEVGVKAFEDLEARYPNEAALIQNRAVLAGKMEDKEHELLLAGRWAQIERKNPEALKYYGQKLLDSESWIFARDAFKRAIRLRPEASDLDAMWGLVQAEAGMGEYNKCIRLIQDIKEVSSAEKFNQELNRLPIPEELRERYQPKEGS